MPTDGRLDARLGQSLRILDRDVLDTAIAVMDMAAAMNGTPLMKRLFQSIEYEPGVRRSTHPPSDNPGGEGVDDEGHVDEALPGGDIGEVLNPQPVRRMSLELAVHAVQ